MAINALGRVVVGVFEDRFKAQRAVEQLVANNFDTNDIGVAARGIQGIREPTDVVPHPSLVAEGAAAGAAAGAGAGAVWALGVAVGLLPAVGPVVVGGLLGSVLASAASGAAVAGILGALVGLGISTDEAKYYEREFNVGRTLVTVRADGREDEATLILRRNGGILRPEHVAAH
jgi:hypothetical protein